MNDVLCVFEKKKREQSRTHKWHNSAVAEEKDGYSFYF